MLGGRDDLIVVGEASDGDQVPDAVRRTTPDVVLMDVRMPHVNGIEAARRLLVEPDPPTVVMLTTFGTEADVVDALAAGAAGFLVKDTPPPALVQAIIAAASGDTILSPSIARTVVDHVRRSRELKPPAEVTAAQAKVAETRALLQSLTDRELEVAVAIGRGLSNAEIAAELFMSVATVKAHVTRVLEKLDANNRVQVAIVVHDAGLV